MWQQRRLSYPRPGKQHSDTENQCLLVFGIPIYAVLQAEFEFGLGKQENHSTSSVPFSSGRYLPALIHETELCYEGIRSILTIKSESKQRPKACLEKGAFSDSVSTLIVRYSVFKSNCAALSSLKVLFLLCD